MQTNAWTPWNATPRAPAVAAALCLAAWTPMANGEADTRRLALQGRQLLAQYQCGSCHVIPGVARARGTQGPPLTALGRRSYLAGHIPNRADTLARWIESPASLVPGTAMPAMGATPDEARAMAAYLATLR